MAVLPLVITDLTQGTLEGMGVFDALMRANKVHLEAEFQKNRIKGPEYATVYLGSLQAVMQAALTFLSQSQKVTKEIGHQVDTQAVNKAGNDKAKAQRARGQNGQQGVRGEFGSFHEQAEQHGHCQANGDDADPARNTEQQGEPNS